MKIIIETIEHSKQRYNTVGDWFVGKDETLYVRVSKLGEPLYEKLIAVHELVEALLCLEQGVTQESVDKFDMMYKHDGEPGEDPDAPYYKQHQIAEIIERLLARDLEIDWAHYSLVVESLG